MSDGPMFDQVNLVVGDMEASAAFYRLLGVAFDDVPAQWAPHHRTMLQPSGGADVELDSQHSAAVWGAGEHGVVLGFKLADRTAVDDAFTRLVAAGHIGRRAPYDAFWGARYALVEDPDGNVVGLMSPSEPERRTAPPEPPATP